MEYVIQNIKTKKYIKHDGNHDMTHYPFFYVETSEQAEQYSSLEHALYAAFWYVDRYEDWRVIDVENGRSYVRNEDSRWILERGESI